MRWVIIIIIIAVAGVSGWFVASQPSVQKYLMLPVQNWFSGGETPENASLPEEVGLPEATAEDEAPEPTDPEVPPVDNPDPAPPSVELDGDAALTQYRTWISEARATHPYPDSEQRMYDVMMCESGGNASIVNPAGPYTGLFQYATGTWNGDWNSYRDDEITNARAQIFATALAWSLNMQSQWGCYTRAH